MSDSYYKKDVEDFFFEKPQQLNLYQAVESLIDSIGPVTIEISKSQISFGTKTKFAWVWLPPIWSTNRPENCIVLTFGAEKQIDDEQIVEVVEPYPGRFTHHIIIEDESDLTDQVYRFLCEAYDFSQNHGRGKKENANINHDSKKDLEML
jgi:hypothetical protein